MEFEGSLGHDEGKAKALSRGLTERVERVGGGCERGVRVTERRGERGADGGARDVTSIGWGRPEAFDRTSGRDAQERDDSTATGGSDGKRSVMVNLHTTAKDGELTEGPVAELVSDVSKVDAVSSVVHTSVLPNEPKWRHKQAAVHRNSSRDAANANAKKKVVALYVNDVLGGNLPGWLTV